MDVGARHWRADPGGVIVRVATLPNPDPMLNDRALSWIHRLQRLGIELDSFDDLAAILESKQPAVPA